MDDFLLCLPEEMENKDFVVLAREGGYAVDIEMVLDGDSNYFDILAQRDQVQILLRVYLTRDQIMLAEKDVELVRFENLTVVILDYDGLETDQILTAFLYINTQVTIPRVAAGKLRLWHQEITAEGLEDAS